MTKAIPQNTYQDYATHYDQLWMAEREDWNRALGRLLRSVTGRAESVCELGCGTGTRAIEFARRGLRVFGVDLSKAMLRAARQKARGAGVRIRFMKGDMRSFRLPERVDLINSEWGVTNHLPRKTDLTKVARAVRRALKPGGYYVFDVNNRAVFERDWAQTYLLETAALFFRQRGGYDARRGIGWLEVAGFAPNGRGMWKRFDHRFEEVHWSRHEVVQTLRGAGFHQIRAIDFAAASANGKKVRVQQSPGSKTVYLARAK
ncbi:MAG: class I SAM-dependent methyltransferase [Candidatus Acidiferrales bacterium]